MSKWTEEMIATATRLWEQGFSASGIAGTLGTVSRCAVIGKMRRMGVEGGGTGRRIIKKKKPHRFQWSDASIQTLKRMWRTDCSAVEIARELAPAKVQFMPNRGNLALALASHRGATGSQPQA